MKNKFFTIIGLITIIAFISLSCGGDGGLTNSSEEGIYIGIIKFAERSEDITGGAPILLNAVGKTDLTNIINSQVSISTNAGTALFHAVHLALANLKKNESDYPDNLDFVNIITFTDGLDISSVGLSLSPVSENKVEGREFSDIAAYTTYVNTEINNRKIAGKSITAYSVGVKGDDVTDDTRFTSDLASIASAGKSNELSDFADLQDTFNDIGGGLNITTTTTNFRLTTALLAPGVKVRMTFDVNTTDPADAAASTRYIEGTYTISGGTYSLTNITYGGGISSSNGTGPITGTYNSQAMSTSFVFSDITGYTPGTDESKTRQWLMLPGTLSWQHNSEYNSAGSNDSTVERRSVVIYLVLDCSGSLSSSEVVQIRNAAISFINNLYAVWSGNQYTITFDANEGSGGPTTVKVVSGISMPNLSSQTPPTRAGYVFTGYFDAQTGGTKYYNANLRSARNWDKESNAALYAQWLKAIEMVSISGGTFMMGQSDISSATPVHEVTLTQFYMGKYQVTQEQYVAVMGSNPSYFSSSPATGEVQGKRPVEMVSWYDALVFCNRLSIMEGLAPAYSISGNTNPADWGTVPTSNNLTWNAVVIESGSTGYRLPTEAQWEYACRAGAVPPTIWFHGDAETGLGNYAWYDSNSGSRTHEVGKKLPNTWGLYDMHGNVWEWCWDWYGSYSSGAQIDPVGAVSGSYRVLRGGSWRYGASTLRSAYRYGSSYAPGHRDNVVGLRVVRP